VFERRRLVVEVPNCWTRALVSGFRGLSMESWGDVGWRILRIGLVGGSLLDWGMYRK
jgi:hypothetical protein